MSETERLSVVIALRELNGWVLLPNGRWQEPEWMTKARAAERQ